MRLSLLHIMTWSQRRRQLSLSTPLPPCTSSPTSPPFAAVSFELSCSRTSRPSGEAARYTTWSPAACGTGSVGQGRGGVLSRGLAASQDPLCVCLLIIRARFSWDLGAPAPSRLLDQPVACYMALSAFGNKEDSTGFVCLFVFLMLTMGFSKIC